MPKQALVTAETVFAAADRLLVDGKQPSQRLVRDLVGGGSLSTIGPILRSWRQSRAGGEDGTEPNALRTPLPPRVAASVSALNQAAEALIQAVQASPGKPEEAGGEDAGLQEGEQTTTNMLVNARPLQGEIESLRVLAEKEILRLRNERNVLRDALEEAQEEIKALREQRSRFRDHVEALTMRLSSVR